jgi:prophage regulatory protein
MDQVIRDQILREVDCRRITGLSRTTRWRLVQAGDFPPPLKLSKRAIGWSASSVAAWLEQRLGGSSPCSGRQL